MPPHPMAEMPPLQKTPSLPAVEVPHDECAHCGRPYSSEPWARAVKRKVDEDETASEGHGGGGGELVGLSRTRSLPPLGAEEWHDGVEDDELQALREEVAELQRTIQELYDELDEERNASTTATNETMTMILKLQREKADVQLEAKQFKRFAEERMDQDQQEIAELEQEVRALTAEVEDYRRRIQELIRVNELAESETKEKGGSYGGSGVLEEGREEEAEEEEDSGFSSGRSRRDEVPYPGVSTGEIDKYDLSPPSNFDAPPSRAESEHIEQPLEEEPTTRAATIGGGSDHEDEVIITNSPNLSRTSSFGTAGSYVPVDALHDISDGGGFDDDQQDVSSSVMVVDHALDVRPDSGREDHDHGRDHHDVSSSVMVVDHALDVRPDTGRDHDRDRCHDDDESSDRVYTIDAVHGVPLPDPPAPVVNQTAPGGVMLSQDDLRMLTMRLMALEEDRETLKQALLSMRSGGGAGAGAAAAAAPRVSLSETVLSLRKTALSLWATALSTAQKLGKAGLQIAQEKVLSNIHYLYWALSLLSLLKWIAPLIFYQRKRDERIRATQAVNNELVSGWRLWLATKLLGVGQLPRSLE